MNKPTFIFDDVCVTPDRQIGRHSHSQWELSMVICGAGTRTIGDTTEPAAEGEIILIPPNIPHVWQFDPSHTDADGNIANISVFFTTVTLDGFSLFIPEIADTVNRLKSLTEAVNIKGEAYDKVYELLMSMRGLTATARVPKMIELIMSLGYADNCVPAGRNNSLSRAEQRLERVRTFCNCNYAREISLGEMASYAGMNKSAFCTFMRRMTGMSLSEFVNDIRLSRARDMLIQTDKNIANIAYDTGFANVTYFNRLFRNKYNSTPKSARMNKIDASISRYVEDEIIPRYATFDKAHQADHVNMVIKQSMELAESEPDMDRNMVYVVAAFHDLGLVNGRENHHVDSRRILEADEFVKGHFSPEQIRLMGEAVEDHRASKSGKPRNRYGLIVAEADRFIDSETIIRRTIQYGLKNYPELDREGHYDRTIAHLEEKYGCDGYLKIWLPQSDNARRLEELRRVIADRNALRVFFDRIFDEEISA